LGEICNKLLQKERKSLTITIQFKLAKQESPRRISAWIFQILKGRVCHLLDFFFCVIFFFSSFFWPRCNGKKCSKDFDVKIEEKEKDREKSSNKKQKLKWREKEIF